MVVVSFMKNEEESDAGVGTKSIARRKLGNLADLTTVSTGLAVFRATLDVSAISNDPELAHLYQEPGINLWLAFSRCLE